MTTETILDAINALTERVVLVEQTLETGHISEALRARTAYSATIAEMAEVAYAIDAKYTDDLREQITHDVVNTLAQRIAEKYETIHQENSVDFLCDLLMDLL